MIYEEERTQKISFPDGNCFHVSGTANKKEEEGTKCSRTFILCTGVTAPDN